jgi:hypothetical protein
MILLDNNPFRVLGLNVTASEKEIVKSVSTLTTYLEMGKEKKLVTDFPFLKPIKRTSGLIIEARKLIEQPEDKFHQSLFWYWVKNATDEIVMELLLENNISKSIELLEKAVFNNRQKSFVLSVLTKNFIEDKQNWGGIKDDETHAFKRIGLDFVMERKIEKSTYSIATEEYNLDFDDNWSIECDSNWISGLSNNPYGLVIGSDGNGCYYSFCVNADGNYNFLKFTDWNYENIISWTDSPSIRENGYNHLKVVKANDSLEFFINNQKVNSIEAPNFIGNRIGFRVYEKQKVSFSNLKISCSVEDDSYCSGINLTTKNYSNLKNLGLLLLHEAFQSAQLDIESLAKAISLTNVFLNSSLLDDYSFEVSGNKFKFNLNETSLYYINTIIDNLKSILNTEDGITDAQVISLFSNFPTEVKNSIVNKFILKNIQNIEEAVELTKKLRKENPSNAIQFGKKLKQNTILDLLYVKNILKEENLRYISLADKIANEIIQCGIDSFNTFKTPEGEIDYVQAIPSEEAYMEEYEFANNIAASLTVKEKAADNLDSCKKVIANKDYLFCWFCKNNPPDKSCAVNTVIYKETNRSYFPRSVNFKYLELKVPRCSHCQKIHEQRANRSTLIVVGVTILGVIIGSVVQEMNAIAGGFLGLIAGYIVKEIVVSTDSGSKTKEGTRDISDAPLFPEVKKYIHIGWTTTKPTA